MHMRDCADLAVIRAVDRGILQIGSGQFRVCQRGMFAVVHFILRGAVGRLDESAICKRDRSSTAIALAKAGNQENRRVLLTVVPD